MVIDAASHYRPSSLRQWLSFIKPPSSYEIPVPQLVWMKDWKNIKARKFKNTVLESLNFSSYYLTKLKASRDDLNRGEYEDIICRFFIVERNKFGKCDSVCHWIKWRKKRFTLLLTVLGNDFSRNGKEEEAEFRSLYPLMIGFQGQRQWIEVGVITVISEWHTKKDEERSSRKKRIHVISLSLLLPLSPLFFTQEKGNFFNGCNVLIRLIEMFMFQEINLSCM